MSGAQGALPSEVKTPTQYESVPGGENRTKLDLHSREDEGMIQIEKKQDKVQDPLPVDKVNPVYGAATQANPIFGASKGEDKQDMGVTGTG